MDTKHDADGTKRRPGSAWTAEERAAHWKSRMDLEGMLFEESDRGILLVTSSALESVSRDILEAALLPFNRARGSKEITYHLNAGSLATHGFRTLLAFTLGLIGPSMYTDLNVIRKLRNDFAHSPRSFSLLDA